MKKMKVEPRKTYFLYILVGILAIVGAVLFFPLWAKTDLPWANWGTQIINIIIALCLASYLAYYLFPKVLHGGSGAIHILVIVEFALLALIALGCVLSQFQIINISGACAIFGFCLLARGVVEIFRAYYQQKDSKVKYPVWWLAVAIAMVIFGTYLIASPLFSNEMILWLFVLILLAFGLFLIVYGVRCKPAKKAKKEKKEKN